MKRKVYIETSIVSYYTGQPTRDLVISARQEETRELWPRLVDKYESRISTLVLTESREGHPERAKERLDALSPFLVLDITPEICSPEQLVENENE